MLANSQNFIFQKANGYFPSQDNALALTHHHKALKLAGEMMKRPDLHSTDEVIGTVLSFLAHQALLGSFEGGEWQTHRNALLRLIRLRGGFDKIDKQHLRITISWCDLLVSFGQDIPSVIPLPTQWITDANPPTNSPRHNIPISLTWKRNFPARTDWITIFDDIAHLISRDRAFSEQQQLLALTSGSWIEPTLARLLGIRPLIRGGDREHVMEEVCRLGMLLFLAPFWRVLGQNPVHTAAISRNLLAVLRRYAVAWDELKPLLAWVLYVAAVETADLSERSQFVSMLAALARSLGLQAWEDVLGVVKSVLWVEVVFTGSDELVHDAVMQIVNRAPDSVTVDEASQALGAYAAAQIWDV